MHLVLGNQWFPPESGWGGVAMWNYEMARAYRALGVDVTVITSRTSSRIPAFQKADGIRIQRLLVRDVYRWRRLPGVGRYVREAQQLVYAWRVNQCLGALHREQPIDVVEFADVNAEGFFFARHPVTPFVVRCHTPTFVLRRYYSTREMPYDTRLIGWCEKDMIRRAPALTAPSKDIANVISNDCRVPMSRIAVIPNALSLGSFKGLACPLPSDGPLTVLFVGRLERVKGIAVLAEAIPQVIRESPDTRFVLVGEDVPTPRGASQRGELERQLAEAAVLSNVELAGAVDQATLVEWYRRADVCVVPSLLYESFSYTCAQAMAAGKPVVASRVGGIPETIDDDVNGIIVSPGNADELAAAILRLVRDQTRRHEMGLAGRNKAAREFDPIKVAQRNLEVYARAARTFQR
jgi:glycogen synthase